MSPPFRLIVGLGNPGREYARTRHNAGFMVLDGLAEKMGAAWRVEKNPPAQIALAHGVLLVKPLAFMNLSGEPVAILARFYKIAAAEILVVFDDAALPLGKLRLRARGSSGGHNGVQSIIEHLGTQNFPRLRIGIGAAGGKEMTSHVLGKFSSEELPVLEGAVARAVEAIERAQKNGIQSAMNLYNA